MVDRIGGRTPIPIDVRIIAATNKDLEAEIRRGHFREDLFYRLNVIQVKTPALREIAGDIQLMVEYFLEESARDLGREPAGISPDALHLLEQYHWPGNVRQLQNELRRLVVVVRGRQIEPADLSEGIRRGVPALRPPALAPQTQPEGKPAGLQDELALLEKRRILEALAACKNNQLQTAKRLGLSRQGLINKLKRYGIKSGGGEE
jgi:DNA-binding NtrC family response regulator